MDRNHIMIKLVFMMSLLSESLTYRISPKVYPYRTQNQSCFNNTPLYTQVRRIEIMMEIN